MNFSIFGVVLMKIKVKNRSMHDMSHMGSYLQSFLPYAQKRMGFNRPPTIFFDSDPENANNVLGKTGYYNPETDEIVIFVDKRHPKDILRSLSHELIHHSQNCRGDLDIEVAGETTPGYAQSNAHMREMESEAYKLGNGLYFRDWEDSLKNQVEETNYKHITGDNHKMATYEQLKEEITAKVVAAITEKLTKKVEEGAKPDFLDLDGDGDKKEPMKKAAKDKELKKEEEELEERRKRDTPRDSDRREPEKLKINEDDELEEITIAAGGGNTGDREEEEDMTNELFGLGAKKKAKALRKKLLPQYSALRDKMDALQDAGKDVTLASRLMDMSNGLRQMMADPNYSEQQLYKQFNRVKAALRDAEKLDEIGAQEPYVDGDREDEETMEEAVSNDQWYNGELFESLVKKWAK